METYVNFLIENYEQKRDGCISQYLVDNTNHFTREEKIETFSKLKNIPYDEVDELYDTDSLTKLLNLTISRKLIYELIKNQI
jgi:hypothetical protein